MVLEIHRDLDGDALICKQEAKKAPSANARLAKDCDGAELAGTG